MSTSKRPPKRVTVKPDDGPARFCGRSYEGHQFFLANPVVGPTARRKKARREYLALYLFDNIGGLLSATIADLGLSADLDPELRQAQIDKLLASLGGHRYCAIKVVPFLTTKYGTEFGFKAHPPEEADGNWRVTAEPGTFMTFWPPFVGSYDPNPALDAPPDAEDPEE